MNIRTLREAEQAINAFKPTSTTYKKGKYSLEHLYPMLEVFDNPQNKLKIVHVAGTSGKTSTCYYISTLLKKRYRRVGLTVSPHVDSIVERVQVNGKPISNKLFCAYLNIFLSTLTESRLEPSYFELLMIFALWVFVQEGVDYAVVETGLGGLLDASNVVQRSDKICVLTDIGFDHQAVLGNTIAEIAAQKAGVMHAGNHAFCFDQGEEVMNVFRTYADNQNALLHVVQESRQDAPADLPLFQRHNFQLAKAVVEFILKRDDIEVLTKAELTQSSRLIVPARMQSIHYGNKTIIMDGAHNEQKMKAFVDSYTERYKKSKVPVVVAFKQGKDYESALDLLFLLASEIIITTFTEAQDMPFHAIDPKILREYCESQGFNGVTVAQTPNEALKRIIESDKKSIIVTGSFYLISELRRLFKENN
jgi:dihydrofolate synthase/folylpolyglutamate synthase